MKVTRFILIFVALVLEVFVDAEPACKSISSTINRGDATTCTFTVETTQSLSNVIPPEFTINNDAPFRYTGKCMEFIPGTSGQYSVCEDGASMNDVDNIIVIPHFKFMKLSLKSIQFTGQRASPMSTSDDIAVGNSGNDPVYDNTIKFPTLLYPTNTTLISPYVGDIQFRFAEEFNPNTFGNSNYVVYLRMRFYSGTEIKFDYASLAFSQSPANSGDNYFYLRPSNEVFKSLCTTKTTEEICDTELGELSHIRPLEPSVTYTVKFYICYSDVENSNEQKCMDKYEDNQDISSTNNIDPKQHYRWIFSSSEQLTDLLNSGEPNGGKWYYFGEDNDMNVTTTATYCNSNNPNTNQHCESGKGQCDYATSLCVCHEGWKGEHCETRTSLSPVVIAVIIIASILVAAILIGVIAVLLFKRYLREKRKIVLVAPDFEKLCFVSVKYPDYPPEISSKFDSGIIEQLIINDGIGMDVLWEVTKIMPLTDSDNFAKALVYAFARHDKALSLIMHFIQREVAENEDGPDTLFRANSYATKAFKFYSKMIGLPYLFRTIAVLLQGMLRELEDQEENAKTESESDVKLFKVQYELDPEKMDESGDENINVLMLQLTCQKFLVQILRSAPNCPGEFKQLCAHIKSVVQDRFPDYVSKAIGAFIFLRFFNTGITVPETYGLMPTPPKQQARRQLILLSKVLQNLANGVKFGSKESFMVKLNGFIEANQKKLVTFYDQICDPNGFASEKVEVNASIYDPSLAQIYYQCACVYITDPQVFNNVPDISQMLSQS